MSNLQTNVIPFDEDERERWRAVKRLEAELSSTSNATIFTEPEEPIFNQTVSLEEALKSRNLRYAEAIIEAYNEGYAVRLV